MIVAEDTSFYVEYLFIMMYIFSCIRVSPLISINTSQSTLHQCHQSSFFFLLFCSFFSFFLFFPVLLLLSFLSFLFLLRLSFCSDDEACGEVDTRDDKEKEEEKNSPNKRLCRLFQLPIRNNILLLEMKRILQEGLFLLLERKATHAKKKTSLSLSLFHFLSLSLSFIFSFFISRCMK